MPFWRYSGRALPPLSAPASGPILLALLLCPIHFQLFPSLVTRGRVPRPVPASGLTGPKRLAPLLRWRAIYSRLSPLLPRTPLLMRSVRVLSSRSAPATQPTPSALSPCAIHLRSFQPFVTQIVLSALHQYLSQSGQQLSFDPVILDLLDHF